MYELKTILPEYALQLPTCMYPMKVHNNSVASEIIKADASSVSVIFHNEQNKSGF